MLALSVALFSYKPTLANSNLEDALKAYRSYNFKEAERLIAAGLKASKNKQEDSIVAKLNNLSHQINTAERLFNHAARITVIDSITVPAEDFLSYYKLPSAAGKILSADRLPEVFANDFQMAYSNEAEDFMILSQNPFSIIDSNNLTTSPSDTITAGLVQTNQLTDGSWVKPHLLPNEISDFNGILPFLTSDGTLLYFASTDDKDSLGGYDLYVASRDSADDSYLQPSNLGMPFNSPFNDFMLAVDEENGVGWWATDRNQIPDSVTIYIYLLPKERDELIDDENAVKLALMSDYRLSWQEEDYSELIDKIKNIDPNNEEPIADFHLPMPGGIIYSSFSDFRNNMSYAYMEQYLDLNASQEDDLAELSELRRQFASRKTNTDLKNRIIQLESATSSRAEKMRKFLSDIYRLEIDY